MGVSEERADELTRGQAVTTHTDQLNNYFCVCLFHDSKPSTTQNPDSYRLSLSTK